MRLIPRLHRKIATSKVPATVTAAMAMTLATTLSATPAAADELRDDFQDFSRVELLDIESDAELAALVEEKKLLGFKLKLGVGGGYHSNPLGRPANAPDDWVTAPSAALEWLRPSEDVELKLAAQTVLTRGNDIANFVDNDQFELGAVANFKVLGKVLDGFVPSLSYRWRGTYQPVFDARTQSAHDVALGLAKRWLKGDETYALTFEATNRSAAPETGNRRQLSAKFTYVRQFKTWKLQAEPQLQYSSYSDGANNGREDFSLGAKVGLEYPTQVTGVSLVFSTSLAENFSNRPAVDEAIQFSIGAGVKYELPF